ncbi:MAG: response regulator transcription factor [Anaerolineales bacterium]|nr:response regulator transcription factor [Anaerolineales bacterium]
MNAIRVLIVDDHTILRAGLRVLLSAQEGIEVVGEAENGRQAVDQAQKLQPDVVLMDIAMPLLNGIDAAEQILRSRHCARILMLTMYESEEYIRRALAVGACGYLLKDTDPETLVNAIRSVYQGESILSPAITRLVIEDYLRWGEIRSPETNDELTPREREVLQLIAEGYTNRQIADILCIAIKTVQAHRTNLMSKLDLHDKAELIKYAIQKKIIEI